MNDTHALIVIMVMGLITFGTRMLPPVIFSRRDKIPDYILYLGDVVPYTAMGLLIVYCLRDVEIIGGSHAVPEAIAMAIVVSTYLWKRNTIMSVVAGTAAYMFMLQVMFK